MAGGMMYETFSSVTNRTSIQYASPRGSDVCKLSLGVFTCCIPYLSHSNTTMISSAELLLTVIHALWPPQNPAHLSDAPDHALALPNSPWTYENDSLNPNLEPSNARLRRAASMGKQHKRQVIDQEFGKSSLPPYHPDFNDANVTNTLEGGDSTSEDSEDTTPFIRAGSEGYEVQSVDREDVLRRYVMELGQEPGRYHRYISSPDSDSDEEHLLQDS